MTKDELLALANEDDPSSRGGRRSAEVRGLPYYGKLRKMFPRHIASFSNMHQRTKDTDFPRTVIGFVDFILYLGPVPEGMEKPTIGREDHSIGYRRGNFAWQSAYDNGSESAIRNNSTKHLPPYKTARQNHQMKDFIATATGKYHVKDLLVNLGRKDPRRVLDELKRHDNCTIIDYVNRMNFSVIIH